MKDVLRKGCLFVKDLFSFNSRHEQKRRRAIAWLKQFNDAHPSYDSRPHQKSKQRKEK